MVSPSSASSRMTVPERRSALALAAIFALRMFGLFLVLPVMPLAATSYTGGQDAALIGLAMGIYGLTQALLQIPMGLASDRFGRKKIIVLGLIVFALGGAIAALSESIYGLVVGRAVQGAGAISAAVTALLADQTRDEVRTKAMALVGISIGAMFSLALILGPFLGARIGLQGLFWLTSLLAIGAILVVIWVVPEHSAPVAAPSAKPIHENSAPKQQLSFWQLLAQQPALLHLNLGVFVLHLVQLAMWSAVPRMLVAADLAKPNHWMLYLPVVISSAVFFGVIFALERKGRGDAAVRISIALIGVAQLLLGVLAWSHAVTNVTSLVLIAIALFLFFCGFNALEAMQPSMASRLAPLQSRGLVLGIYGTVQSLGLFAGGVLGGVVVQTWGVKGLFTLLGVTVLVWLLLTWNAAARLTKPEFHGVALEKN